MRGKSYQIIIVDFQMVSNATVGSNEPRVVRDKKCVTVNTFYAFVWIVVMNCRYYSVVESPCVLLSLFSFVL